MTAPLVERILAPFRRFAHTASSSGIVLIVVALIAIVWANSPWAASYAHLWETTFSFGVAGWQISGDLHHIINDGLMAVFFFVVGLEIKRELVAGELKTMAKAALPLFAALGGMVVPAAIYAALNARGPGFAGWGVPMATDIAFALGVLALLGNRVPVALKVFLAALAIADDIGAIIVIAIFYSGAVNWVALGIVAVILLLSLGANAAGVRHPWAYGIIGLVLWAAVFASGVHATVAGVLLAMTVPVRTRIAEDAFIRQARRAVDDFEVAAMRTANNPDMTALSNEDHHGALEDLEVLVDAARPPLIRMEHALHGIVSFLIMPLFALANAGVQFDVSSLAQSFASPITLGVIAGLLIGKPVGITLFSLLAVRIGIAALPEGVTHRMLIGASILGGIGFTMALFIGGLAFTDAAHLNAAKVGVLSASTVAALLGWFVLRGTTRAR